MEINRDHLDKYTHLNDKTKNKILLGLKLINLVKKRIEFLSDEHKEREPDCRFCDLRSELQKLLEESKE